MWEKHLIKEYGEENIIFEYPCETFSDVAVILDPSYQLTTVFKYYHLKKENQWIQYCIENQGNS